MLDMPAGQDPRAFALMANANLMLQLGITAPVLNSCWQCSTPALGSEPGDLLVCGYCGADDQVFTQVTP